MTSPASRIDALLSPARDRDILIHIGRERPGSTPPGLTGMFSEHLDDGSIFDLFAGQDAPIQTSKSVDGLRHAFVLGSAFHPHVRGDSVAQWALDRIEKGELGAFSALEGVFTVFVLDRRESVLHLVTDVLGLRPVYIRRSGSDTWISNRVGTSWDRDAFAASINMEALRSWAYFGYNATDGALLAGWRRPPPAARVLIRAEAISESSYRSFDFAARETDARDCSDAMFESLKRSVRIQTREQRKLKLALSGGFDSRLLAALAAPGAGDRLRALVVNGSDNYRDRIDGQSTESWVARTLCERLGIGLELIDIEQEPMCTYGEPFLLRSDGFPITKQIIMLVVGEQDATPIINGALGGNLLGGLWDCIGGKTEGELREGELVDLLLRRHSQLATHLLTPAFADAIGDWARSFMTEMIAPYRSEQRAVVGLGIWMHDRLYMSNNFLQHLHLCEPIVPFATAELVDLKLAVQDGILSMQSFRDALKRHFPSIGDIPHSKDLKRPPKRLRLTSPIKRAWADEVLLSLRRNRSLGPFNHKVLAPRLAMAALDGRLEYVPQTAMRFLLLEKLVERLGLSIDWNG